MVVCLIPVHIDRVQAVSEARVPGCDGSRLCYVCVLGEEVSSQFGLLHPEGYAVEQRVWSREQGAGSREQGAGSREQGAGSRGQEAEDSWYREDSGGQFAVSSG
jgi:hypothetical protein